MPKRRTRTITRYVRRPGRRGKKGFTLPLAAIAGFAPLLHYAYSEGWKQDGVRGVGMQMLYGTTGWDGYNKVWNVDGLRRGMLPIIGGILVHKLIGGKLGVNRMLARAGVPVIRI